MPKFLADTTPLKTPAFRRLWLAGVVSQLGAQFTVVAVPVQLYQLTHSSAYVWLAGLAALLPMLILAPLGGFWPISTTADASWSSRVPGSR